jgi:hypothetical protein
MFQEVLVEHLKHFFPEDEDSDYFCDVKQVINNNIELNIYKGDNKCLHLTIDPNDKEIYIAHLMKCRDTEQRDTNQRDPPPGSGTDNIKRLIGFCKKYGYKVKLEDESKIMNIKLINLFILSTGESWYNSMGLKEINYHENTRLLQNFIQQSISILLDKNNYIFSEKKRKIDDLDRIISENKNKIDHLNRIMPENIKTQTIQSTFEIIKRKLKNNEELEDYENYLIELFLKLNVLRNLNFKIEGKNLIDILNEKTYLKTGILTGGKGVKRKQTRRRCNYNKKGLKVKKTRTRKRNIFKLLHF